MSGVESNNLIETPISPLDESLNLDANGRVMDVLLKEDEITWQAILQDLVKTQQMDPWDVDLKKLSNGFMDTIKQLDKMDFRISGKMVLASAILLKMKSHRFLSQDLDSFDRLVNFMDEYEDELMDSMDELEYELFANEVGPEGKPKIFPRTPQPRKRKVSIFDLVDALEKALEVKQRRRPLPRNTFAEVAPPKEVVDINEVMVTVQKTIMNMLQGRKNILFNELIPSETKEDKVLTFIPCLHLDNQRQIDLIQETQFGNIEIHPSFNLGKELDDVDEFEDDKKESKKSKKDNKPKKVKQTKL